MHRVDADGTIDVGGERRFVDRALPTYEGTVDGAYWNNAVQEEIATVVEYAGLTLRASGAADESAGWDQLKTAIFESTAISNGALSSDLSLTKFSQGDLGWTNGGVTSAMTTRELLLDSTGTISGHLHRKGLHFYGSGTPGSVFPYLRSSVFNITSFISGASTQNAITGIADGHSHKMGVTYDNIYNTNIETSTRIYHSAINIEMSDGDTVTVCCDIDYTPGYTGAPTKWHINRIIQFTTTQTDDLDDATAVYLTVYYDGDYLDP